MVEPLKAYHSYRSALVLGIPLHMFSGYIIRPWIYANIIIADVLLIATHIVNKSSCAMGDIQLWTTIHCVAH